MSTRGSLCVTVDLDPLDCYRDIHGMKTRGAGVCESHTIGVRRALELFDELGIATTLFVIGNVSEVEEHATILEQAHADGHELASHSYSHHYDLRHKDAVTQLNELERAELVIEDICGVRPVGFRAPGYNIDETLLELCAARGYAYDSSMLGSAPYYLAKAGVMSWLALTGRPSGSSMVKANTLLAPTTPYRPKRSAIWKHDSSSDLPVEIPMCVMPGTRIPVIGTSLHLFGARGFKAMYRLLRRANPDILQLEFHAIDFMDSDDPGVSALREVQPDTKVPWRDKRKLYKTVFERALRDYDTRTLRDAVSRLEL